MLSKIVVNIYTALLELGLWLMLVLGLVIGWQAKGFPGAVGGAIASGIFGAVFFGAFLVLNDIRNRVKVIEDSKDLFLASLSGPVVVAGNLESKVHQTRRESAGKANGLDEARKHIQNPITADQYAEKYGISLARVEEFVAQRLLLSHSVADQLYVVDRRLPDHLLK